VNGLPGVTGAVVLDSANSYVQGNRLYVKVVGAVVKGGLTMYVAGSGSVPDGATLTNAESFMGVVLTPAPTKSTPDAPFLSYDPATRVLTFQHALGTSELEYNRFGGTFTSYAPIQVDDSSHNAGEWKARVKAMVGRNPSGTADSPAITAKATVNQLPVVSVGDHLTITAPTNSAALMATANDYDPGDTLTLQWRQITGPSSATGMPATSLNVLVSNLIVGTYQFGFQATDQKGGKSQEAFVVITMNAAPVGGVGNGESFTIGQGDFAFTTYDLNKGAYWQRSGQARIGIDTHATSLEVGVQAILGATYPSIQAAEHLLTITDAAGNFVNHLLPATTSGEQTLTVSNLLGSGVRRFYITEPENTQAGATDFIGTYLTKVKRLNDSILQRVAVVRAPNRVVVSGNSISVGNGASNTSCYAWVVCLRQLLGAAWEVANTGWGIAYAGGRFNMAALQQAEANRVVSYFAGATGAKVYIDVLGTNDAYYVPGDPATIAAYKAGVWDKIHALDPTIRVYSGTPLWRGNKDSANSLGKVLADYATAFNTVAQSRSAYVTAVDCLSWLSEVDFRQTNTGIPVDNLHPNDTGHFKVAQYWYGYAAGQSIAANLQVGEVVQEDDPRITYGGAWKRNDYSPESYLFRLGALRYTTAYGATAAIPTDGTQLRFGTYTENGSGIFELLYNSIVITTYSLAGPQQRIDIYSPVVVPAGNHKFLLRKRDNDGANIYLDEVEITDGSFTPTPSLPNGTGGGMGGGTGVTVDYEENSPVWTNANGFNMGNGAAYAAVSSQPYYEWDGFPGGTAVFESAADPAGGKVDVLVDNVVIMTWTQNGSGRAISSPKLLPSGTLRVQPSTSGAGS
jgi:hypothetical protein